MSALSNHDAAVLKLHLLSEGVCFDNTFLATFASDSNSMEKRRVYNDSDEGNLDRSLRIPQEFYLNDGVIVAVNYKKHAPWHLIVRDGEYRLTGKDTEVEVTFPRRPHFFDRMTHSRIQCGRVANLYGGSSLAFFTPATCYYFNDGHECKFCSLQSNRSTQENVFVNLIGARLAAEVLQIALDTDADLLKQIMLVGGNLPDYNRGFQRHLAITAALDQQQSSLSVDQRLETHIAAMPPRDFRLFNDLKYLNARVTMNIEIFNEDRFEQVCPGKAGFYGRHQLMQALEYAASMLSGKRVHSILIAGLEPIQSTIAGIKHLASIGVTPIVNVFHNDHGSHFEHLSRPPFEDLLEIAYALQETYREYDLTPYWIGCGRNSLDYEAQQGWFS